MSVFLTVNFRKWTTVFQLYMSLYSGFFLKLEFLNVPTVYYFCLFFITLKREEDEDIYLNHYFKQ